MLINYFKVAVRNIMKYKMFSLINILGMTIGIASTLMIILYVSNELSYDNFHQDAQRIYQVGLHGKIGGQDIRVSNTCPPMAEALVNEIPEVESSTRIARYFSPPIVRYEEKMFAEENIMLADSNFFEFFSFSLLQGDPKTVLLEPNTIVITEEIANKYFGDDNPLGKLMVIGNENKTYKVTGVSAKAPVNSHFSYNILVSAISSERMKSGIWLSNWMYTYLKVKPNASVAAINQKFESLVEKYIGPELERFMGTTLKQMKESGGQYGFFTTPMLDIHLRSTTQGDLEPGGNLMYVYFFSGIGIFIIVIACINFMNLSTARSAGRAKEVGLRKTLGSLRAQLIGQFIAESTLYSAVSIILAFVLSYFSLPFFNTLSGKELTMQVFLSPWFIASAFLLLIFVGLISGSYPAFYLTSFKPVEVLKGKVRAGARSKGFRSFLVVFQYGLSIFLIIFTLVVYDQIQFMQKTNLGIDRNNVLTIENADRLGANKEAFRNGLNELTAVKAVSYTNNLFPGVNNTTVFRQPGVEQDHIMGNYYADYNHQQVMKFEMKEGRFFSEEFPSDSLAIIINESAAREFGFTNAVGEDILYNGDGEGPKTYKVIGVIKDFNFESFKDKVRPLSILLARTNDNVMLRYEGNSAEIVSSVEKLWKQYATNEPIQYSFLDDNFDRLFRSELRMGQLFSLFSGLAIFIASLGLFALAAFTAEQRTKEIGIRKSMGATVFSLSLLLSREFTRLVLMAFVPAAVIGWLVCSNWLEGFAFHVDINPFIFIISGLSAVLIAWLTVGYQSLKAAMANPVTSLRYE